MWNFENKVVKQPRPDPTYKYSRYIASWANICRKLALTIYYNEYFREWLESMNVPEDDIINIQELARCGKFELECSAERYIDNLIQMEGRSGTEIGYWESWKS